MSQNAKQPIIIYTDGSCIGNPGPGGWGVVICQGERRKELFGGEQSTTNNRMELTAAIRSLQALKNSPLVVHLHTDSQYVRLGITTWIHDWKSKGWKATNSKPVKNQDLWQELETLASQHHVEWRWVRGHSGDPLNERADQLASLGASKAYKEVQQ